jgi:lysophospholipase L1-like esterase
MLDHKPIKIFIAGDSTVQTYDNSYAPQAGWGQFIADYFTENVQFYNHAIGGRSSKTFVEEGRLDSILNEIEEGDYLFIQMGHNDSTVSKPERYTEPYTTFKRYLKLYLDGAHQHHAHPVIITPVGRLHYDKGVFVNDFPDYCQVMKQLAKEENVTLIDLMKRSLDFYASIGYDEAHTLFMASMNKTDFTHFTEKGAKQIARLLSESVKEVRIDLSNHVKQEAGNKGFGDL